MACEAEQAALQQAQAERNSAALAVENSAIVIDQTGLAYQQAIEVGMQNVEALAQKQQVVEIRQQQLTMCINGGGGPPMPMAMAAKEEKKKDHVLSDYLQLIKAGAMEASHYFSVIVHRICGKI
jgi:hypothetical protein